jgi:hypothetical protein
MGAAPAAGVLGRWGGLKRTEGWGVVEEDLGDEPAVGQILYGDGLRGQLTPSRP